MSALLWCELMNWLGRRLAVYILVPVMSRSLRVIIMSAQRPPLSQSLLRLASWELLQTCFQALQPPTPSWAHGRAGFYYHYPCSNLRLTPWGWKATEECQSRSPTRVGTCPPAHHSIHINPFTGQGHLILCTRYFGKEASVA